MWLHALTGSYPLSRIPGAVLPVPIQPVVQCFVPNLRDIEARKSLQAKRAAKRKTADEVTSSGSPTSSSAQEDEAGSAARQQRKIVDDVRCGMFGYVVEDLWGCVPVGPQQAYSSHLDRINSLWIISNCMVVQDVSEARSQRWPRTGGWTGIKTRRHIS